MVADDHKAASKQFVSIAQDTLLVHNITKRLILSIHSSIFSSVCIGFVVNSVPFVHRQCFSFFANATVMLWWLASVRKSPLCSMHRTTYVCIYDAVMLRIRHKESQWSEASRKSSTCTLDGQLTGLAVLLQRLFHDSNGNLCLCSGNAVDIGTIFLHLVFLYIFLVVVFILCVALLLRFAVAPLVVFIHFVFCKRRHSSVGETVFYVFVSHCVCYDRLLVLPTRYTQTRCEMTHHCVEALGGG